MLGKRTSVGTLLTTAAHLLVECSGFIFECSHFEKQFYMLGLARLFVGLFWIRSKILEL